MIISHNSIYVFQIYEGHCWYNCVLIENTWIVFHLLHGKRSCAYRIQCVYAVIYYTFLQINDNIFILIIKFYNLLHGQSVC